nr:MAG TPA: hypothetical protein [Caudoviricetes sp.]
MITFISTIKFIYFCFNFFLPAIFYSYIKINSISKI